MKVNLTKTVLLTIFVIAAASLAAIPIYHTFGLVSWLGWLVYTAIASFLAGSARWS